MANPVVVGPGLTPDWLRKRNRILKAIDEQLLLGLENPGRGLTLNQLQLLVEHRNPFETREALAVPFKHNLTKKGFKIEHTVLFDGKPFVPKFCQFRNFSESYRDLLNPLDQSMKQGKENAHLGQGHAEYLLRHQDLIPKEYREYELVFFGTVYEAPLELQHFAHLYSMVPYLYWRDDRWHLDFNDRERYRYINCFVSVHKP